MRHFSLNINKFLFKENRLVFQEAPPEKPNLRDTVAELESLHGKVERGRRRDGEVPLPKKWESRRPPDDMAKGQPPRDPKAEEVVGERIKWRGYISSKEAREMQDTHENLLYAHLVNPAFFLFLEAEKLPDGKKLGDVVTPILESAIANPYDLHYTKKGDSLIISKRSDSKNDNIHGNFLILFERGDLTRVRADSVDQFLPIGKNGDVTPWREGGKYQKQMKQYGEMLRSEFGNRIDRLKATIVAKTKEEGWDRKRQNEEWEKGKREIFFGLPSDLRQLYEMNNVHYIKYLKRCMDARNFGFEKKTWQYEMITGFAKTAESYRYELHPDPKQAGVYLIKPNNPTFETAAVSLQGYIMQRDDTGKWVPLPGYKDKVHNSYYAGNAEARKRLETNESAKVNAAIENEVKFVEAIERGKRLAPIRQKINALSDVNKVATLVLKLDPSLAERVKLIVEEKDRKKQAVMIHATKKWLIENLPKASDTAIRIFEDELGITGEKEHEKGLDELKAFLEERPTMEGPAQQRDYVAKLFSYIEKIPLNKIGSLRAITQSTMPTADFEKAIKDHVLIEQLTVFLEEKMDPRKYAGLVATVLGVVSPEIVTDIAKKLLPKSSPEGKDKDALIKEIRAFLQKQKTLDAQGKIIGDTLADYREKLAAAQKNALIEGSKRHLEQLIVAGNKEKELEKAINDAKTDLNFYYHTIRPIFAIESK